MPAVTAKQDNLSAAQQAYRFWEVDILRGIAVVMMIFYHFMWDLNYFGLYQANMLGGPWQTFARGIASTFILVMGLSMTLSYSRQRRRDPNRRLFNKYLRRGAQIFGLGMIITVVTYFFIGRGFVIFGILHLLGLSIILAYPFLSCNKWISLITGLVVIGLGIYLHMIVLEEPWFIWLGIRQYGRAMVDFYPLLPWFGLALIGIFTGYSLYPGGIPRWTLPNLSQVPPVRALRFLGQHSLLIYLIHQPILIGLLLALGYGTF